MYFLTQTFRECKKANLQGGKKLFFSEVLRLGRRTYGGKRSSKEKSVVGVPCYDNISAPGGRARGRRTGGVEWAGARRMCDGPRIKRRTLQSSQLQCFPPNLGDCRNHPIVLVSLPTINSTPLFLEHS